MGREDDIEAIVALGRKTRTPPPRWLWIAAAVVGVVCVCGFTAMMLAAREPASPASGERPGPPIDRQPAVGPGLGIGLAIGLGVGIVIGFSIGRQRRDHSSRNSP